MTSIEEHIDSIAKDHLEDTEGSAQELLRRLHKKLDRQEQAIASNENFQAVVGTALQNEAIERGASSLKRFRRRLDGR